MLFIPLTRSGLRPPLMVKGGWRLSSEAQIRPYCKSRPTTSSIRGGKALQKRTKAGNTGGNSCWRSSAVSTEKGLWLDRIQSLFTISYITTGVGSDLRPKIKEEIVTDVLLTVCIEKGLRLDRIQRLFTMLHMTKGVRRLYRSTLRKNIRRNSCWCSFRVAWVGIEKGLRLDRIQRWYTMSHISKWVGRLSRSN